MNEDQKAVAEILGTELIGISNKTFKRVMNKLADHYEKEDKKKYSQGFVGNIENNKMVDMIKTGFDREQFLKKFGVD